MILNDDDINAVFATMLPDDTDDAIDIAITEEQLEKLSVDILIASRAIVKATTNALLDWMREICPGHRTGYIYTTLPKGGCYECRAELRRKR